jgi:Tetratricopeptide repeat
MPSSPSVRPIGISDGGGGIHHYEAGIWRACWALTTMRRLPCGISLWSPRDSGRPDDAGPLLEQSLAIARRLQDRRGQAQLLLDLGRVRSDQDRLEEAEALMKAVVAAAPSQILTPLVRARISGGPG